MRKGLSYHGRRNTVNNGASLAFNFLNGQGLDPLITFTRASTGTFFNSAGVLQSAAINTPRFDYNPSTLAAQGLLIEEQRTNLLLRSEEFDTAAWNKTAVTISANATVSPSGTASADTMTETAVTDQHLVGTAASGTISSGTTYTLSCFVKNAVGTRKVFLTAFGEGYSVFDPVTGAVVQAGGNVCSVQNCGNGWWRFTAAITKTNTNTGFFIGLWSTTNNYTGDGTSGLFLWGAQLEAGAFPTSYIPTTTTALTRSADVASVNTLSPWFNSAAGTLFAQGIFVGGTAGNFPFQATLAGSNPNTDVIGINWGAASTQMRGVIRVSNVNTMDLPAGPAKVAGNSFRSAVTYQLNNSNFATDGTVALDDTVVTLPAVQNLLIGGPAVFQTGASSWIQRITYYPRRLSNAELQAITA